MTPSNIARLSKAIGNLAFDPGDVFLAALDRRIRRIATHFRPTEARQLLHGLAMLDAVQQNFHAGERYPLGKTYKFLMVNALFSKTCRDGAEIGQMNLLADTQRWFTGDSPIRYHWQSEGRKSEFERQALRTLKYVGIEIMPRVKDENVNHAPDVHGRYKGVELHVECDGPSHMIESCDGQQTYLNGQTVLQTGLLSKALQGSIVRIPIDVFSLNRTRPYFWNGLLRYIVSHKEDVVFLSGTRCPKIEPFGLIEEIFILIWERGAGETQASGSSSCAAASAAVKLGLVKGPVTVTMPGGTLNIEVAEDFSLTMKGPVAEVARGTLSPSFVRGLR